LGSVADMQGLPSVQEMEAYIRAKAVELGIDPDTAVAVARSEGLQPGTWQAKGTLDYGRERSYGPFQLHVAPAGHRQGMGNDFVKATGLDPADPANWKPGVDFALNQAKRGGWSPWYGAKKNDITGFMGISGQPKQVAPQPAVQGAGTSMGGYAEGPSAVAARMPNGGLLAPDENPMQAGNMWTGYGSRWAALGNMAEDLAKQDTQEEDKLPPPLPVLQPLRRITLGKGILG